MLNGGSPCAVPDCAICYRLRDAATELATRDGIETVTMARVGELAGLQPDEVASHYATVEECLLATYDEHSWRLYEVTRRAFRGTESWHERVRLAFGAALNELDARPRRARFCLVEAVRSDLPVLRQRRLAARERLVSLIADEHARDGGDDDLPKLRFEILAGAAQHAISGEIERGTFDAVALRGRMDELISLFDPVPASPAG